MALDQLPWELLWPFLGASRDGAQGYPLSMGRGPWDHGPIMLVPQIRGGGVSF